MDFTADEDDKAGRDITDGGDEALGCGGYGRRGELVLHIRCPTSLGFSSPHCMRCHGLGHVDYPRCGRRSGDAA
jgi:hypothetical protein